MLSLQSAVIEKPTFEKAASFDLSHDSMQWNEEIMKQFFEQVNYLPKELGTEVVINSMEPNEGYAKGSIVVWFNNKKINFPIIIRDFKLSPFDVFIYDNGNEIEYFPANLKNVRAILFSEKMATLQNRYDNMMPQDLKVPGTIAPKVSVPIYDLPEGALEPPFSKMSSLISRVKPRKTDIEKLASDVQAMPSVAQNFVDNTGDLITNIIRLKDNDKYVTLDQQKQGPINLNGVVDAKRAVTVLDSEFIDPNRLVPVRPPSVCELRIATFPTMEDFIESGETISERYVASKVGKPILGVVLDAKRSSDCCEPVEADYTRDSNGNKIPRKPRRDQIFLSLCGKCYSRHDDWDRTNIGFYASNISQVPGAVEKAINAIAANAKPFMASIDWANRGDGSDKLFNPVPEKNEGKTADGYYNQMNPRSSDYYDNGVLVIYGAGDVWECIEFRGEFRKLRINDTEAYRSKKTVLIPAKIGSVQAVSGVIDPVYKMVIGDAKEVFLIPETTIILSVGEMNSINKNDFISPNTDIKKIYEEAGIPKIAVAFDGNGFKISGEAYDPIRTVTGIEKDASLTSIQAKGALGTMGMSNAKANQALLEAAYRFTKHASAPVLVYGVRGDYITTDSLVLRDKQVQFRGLLKEASMKLRHDLVKEASAIDDPEAVDVVLSLNFINEDNLGDYIDNIGSMKKTISKLASMLVASRMGLSELNEGAVKKAMDGLDTVVTGLENIKIAIGK